MLVDDPVKRVDNMTMAWGLEARVPFLDHELVELAAACPPGAEAGAAAARACSRRRAAGVVPGRGDRPAQGLLPGARASGTSPARCSTACGTRCTARPARERGLFRKDYVEELLAAPNAPRTTLGANALWQLGLLEMWLQRIGV